MTGSYVPILILLGVSLANAVGIMVLTHLVSPYKPTPAKLDPYEPKNHYKLGVTYQVPLFDRSSRRGVLNDAGRVLADHAERLVNLRVREMAALDDVRQLRTGRLTMAANELTCLYLLPFLHEYRRL